MDLIAMLWRLKMLRPSGPGVKWTLMAYSDYDYYGGPQYTDAAAIDWCVYADSWFIAPTSLVQAYKNAKATVEFLEANMEAYYQKSRHHKGGLRGM